MPKKPQPEPDPLFGSPPTPPARPGRRAKVPASLKACLEDLEQHTTAWLNRFADVWFNIPTGLEWANGASTTEAVTERYDDAIKTMETLAKAAKDGVAKLKKGKARAAEACENNRKPRGRKQSSERPASPPEEIDYFEIEGEDEKKARRQKQSGQKPDVPPKEIDYFEIEGEES